MSVEWEWALNTRNTRAAGSPDKSQPKTLNKLILNRVARTAKLHSSDVNQMGNCTQPAKQTRREIPDQLIATKLIVVCLGSITHGLSGPVTTKNIFKICEHYCAHTSSIPFKAFLGYSPNLLDCYLSLANVQSMSNYLKWTACKTMAFIVILVCTCACTCTYTLPTQHPPRQYYCVILSNETK